MLFVIQELQWASCQLVPGVSVNASKNKHWFGNPLHAFQKAAMMWSFLKCMPSLAALRELSGEGMMPKFLLWDFRQPSAFILRQRAPDKCVIDGRLDCAPVSIPSPTSCVNFSNFSELIFFKSVMGVRNTYTGRYTLMVKWIKIWLWLAPGNVIFLFLCLVTRVWKEFWQQPLICIYVCVCTYILNICILKYHCFVFCLNWNKSACESFPNVHTQDIVLFSVF